MRLVTRRDAIIHWYTTGRHHSYEERFSGALNAWGLSNVLRTGYSTTSASNDNPHGPIANDEVPSAERYPALDERLQNVEKHLAIRYGENPTATPGANSNHCLQYHHLRGLY